MEIYSFPNFKTCFFTIVLTTACSCGQHEQSTESKKGEDEPAKKTDISYSYPDDRYCAEIDYSNPNTGTHSVYTLIVKVEDNQLTEIEWPSGGVLDSDHFTPEDLDESGNVSFESDNGSEFDVHIKGEVTGCFDGLPPLRRCKGITKPGNQCKNMTDNENGYCNKHQSQAE